MLDNSLDFSGVCTTPVTKSKCDILPGDGLGWSGGGGEDLGLEKMLGPSEHVW